jgi:hypothetical protein
VAVVSSSLPVKPFAVMRAAVTIVVSHAARVVHTMRLVSAAGVMLVNYDRLRVEPEQEQMTHQGDVLRGDAPEFVLETRFEFVTRLGGACPAQKHEGHSRHEKTLNPARRCPGAAIRMDLELLAH